MSSFESGSKKRRRVEIENDEKKNHQDDIDDNEEEEAAMLSMMMAAGQTGTSKQQQLANNDDEDDEERRKRQRQRRERWRRQAENLPQEQQNEATMTDRQSPTTNNNNALLQKSNDVLSDRKNGEDKDDGNDDDFDMFSSLTPPPPKANNPQGATAQRASNNTSQQQQQQTKKTDDWHDDEGYYKAVIGETMEFYRGKLQFTVLGVVGKGVFSTVLKCSFRRGRRHGNNNDQEDTVVALKCIRNNETMSKAAEAEIRFLQTLGHHDHIVRLLLPHGKQQQQPNNDRDADTEEETFGFLEHYGHVCMVFPYEPFNLRDVLQKFGRGVGLTLSSVRAYCLQLLSALLHLQRHNIVHADLKPDNILVNAQFTIVKLCDFGSAFEAMPSSTNAIPTPYLVSRFYRAPEIILGLVPLTTAMDLWSLGVSVAELYLGKVLVRGQDNSDMVEKMMQLWGPFAIRTMKQHLVQVQKYNLANCHFAKRMGAWYFVQETEEIHQSSGRRVVKEISVQEYNNNTARTGQQEANKGYPQLSSIVLKAQSSKDSRVQVLQFIDLLQKICCLDVTKRISVVDAMKHELFQDKKN